MDQIGTAATRICNNNKVATIGDNNIHSVEKLYLKEELPHDPRRQPRATFQRHHLPGDICHTIKKSPRAKGAGANGDTLDVFRDLVSLNIAEVNEDIRQLCDIVFNAVVPTEVEQYFTDTYLFCLYKDPEDLSKLRPLGIPLALRRLVATHVAAYYRQRFAQKLLPINYAIGIDGGMDFVIKTMQLSIEKYIQEPQEDEANPKLPTRAAVFVDLTNMFNNISRKELLDIVQECFPELVPMARLLYGLPGSVRFRWNDGSWKSINMLEGVNQGCPLSAIFAALVLDRVLRPLDTMLRQRAADRLASGDSGDDGFGSISHLFGYVDDNSSCVPLVDLAFFFAKLVELGMSLGCLLNKFKTRILTSCNGESILPELRRINPTLAAEVEATLREYSVEKNTADPEGPPSMVELTSGFRLLGTPVGSPEFAEEFFEEQLKEVRRNIASLHAGVPDLQTRLRMFTQCIIQKLPHLLGADIMHRLPMDFQAEGWQQWNGPLTSEIDKLVRQFLATIAGRETIPEYAALIAQLSVAHGGLGILYAGQRAAPDFVLTMTAAAR